MSDQTRRHPYMSLPDHAFWRSAVADLPVEALSPAVNFPIRITPRDRVATAGSCFAQHIARNLASRGFHYFVTETAHPLGAHVPDLGAEHGYGVFSARFGNVYTSRQLVQLFDRAYGRFSPEEDAWRAADGAWLDPFRPTVEPGGFASEIEMRADRAQHFSCVRRMFEELDVFVFTLGLTETWVSRGDGAAFPLCPGVRGGVFDANRHGLVNLSVAEVVDDLRRFVTGLASVNPAAKVILTVSPVPLVATAEDRHVLVSTVASKSILRAAADEVERTTPQVAYFPSFEIVIHGATVAPYFAADRRSVTEAGVGHVMSVFFDAVTGGAAEGPRPTAGSVLKAPATDFAEGLVQLVCDEEALARETPPEASDD